MDPENGYGHDIQTNVWTTTRDQKLHLRGKEKRKNAERD